MSFKIEDNTVKVKKDCKTCSHINVCKFYSKMRALCRSDEFFEMNEYLEWNNSLEAFELNASCRYFKLNYVIPSDNSLDFSIDKNIIEEVIRLEQPKNVTQYTTSIKDNNVSFSIRNEENVNVKITDLLIKYKFSSK